jgi:hypothetical protein
MTGQEEALPLRRLIDRSVRIQTPDRPNRRGRRTAESGAARSRSAATFGPPKSKRSRRTIALDAETVETLKAHREAQLLERSFTGDAYVDHDLVFADELGTPIYPQRLTVALTNGVLVHVVAARIGDRPETVLRVYAHLLPQSDVEAAEQVAALVA